VSATWATFLFEAANFLLLAILLAWAFFRPVRAAIERRQSEVLEDRRAAGHAREEAERLEEAARTARASLEDSLARLRESQRRDAERERQDLLQEAAERVQRERRSFEEELLALRRTEARAGARDTARAARDILVRILTEIRGPDLEQALVRRTCEQLERLGSDGALAPVIVESATPMDSLALSTIAEAAHVSSAELKHRVTPELVGGLRVLTARGLVDVSVAGIADRASQALAARLEGKDEVDA